MRAPDVNAIHAYLASSGLTGWDDTEVDAALAAERAAQGRACVVPSQDDGWPADLVEALRRRVVRNLAMRRSPVGLQVSDMGAVRISGTDVEIARLEAGHRRWVVA